MACSTTLVACAHWPEVTVAPPKQHKQFTPVHELHLEFPLGMLEPPKIDVQHVNRLFGPAGIQAILGHPATVQIRSAIVVTCASRNVLNAARTSRSCCCGSCMIDLIQALWIR